MMELMTLKQYMKMSKPALIRKITKTLRKMPKKRLAMVCYNLTKSKLPRLRKRKSTVEYDKQGRMISFGKPRIIDLSPKALRQHGYTKTKRKFSKKQLAAQRLFAKRARAGTLRRR
tara:strand:+ start:626 stop:973 length:348 start_codon:yes stop_codon:yes gene_type:complete